MHLDPLDAHKIHHHANMRPSPTVLTYTYHSQELVRSAYRNPAYVLIVFLFLRDLRQSDTSKRPFFLPKKEGPYLTSAPVPPHTRDQSDGAPMATLRYVGTAYFSR
jgi:hypothetical protein